MKQIFLVFSKLLIQAGIFLAALLSLVAAEARHNTPVSDSLRQRILALKVPGLTITDIQYIDTGSYQPAASATAFAGLPAFCLVAVTLHPTPASNIRVELWMPRSGWNGRFLGTGNGGSAGRIVYDKLVHGLKKGYATANTDMGTSPGVDSAIGRPERWIDFGYRATHLMTVVSKQIVEAYYGKAAHHAYFVGCSTGGQQALMEAQRYPGDYNGIIAGAPANNRTHLHTGFILNHNAANGNLFSAADLSYITKTIVSKYAGKDGGAPSDSFLTDPRMINFDPDSLFKCGSGNAAHCLTEAQIAALKKIYRGPVNPRTGEQIYCAPPPGSENCGGGVEFQQTPMGAASLFYPYRWVFGAGFDYNNFDFDRQQAIVDSALAPVLNANNPDLSGFKKAGGKLMMYTGTADALVPYQDAINYYERVVQLQGSVKRTQGFYRYFLIPGMGHCGGGPGVNDFGQNLGTAVKQDSEHDILLALVRWVEKGVAPDRIVAAGLDCCGVGAGMRFERPVYPYPKFPKYIGGDAKSPSSYKGVEHERGSVLTPAATYLR